MSELLDRWEEIVEEFRRRQDQPKPVGKRAWTRRATAIIILVGALLLVATFTGLGWLYVVDALLAALLVASFLLAHWDLRGVRVHRQAPSSASEGEEVPVRLVVENDSERFKVLLELRDRLPTTAPDVGEQILLVDYVPPEGRAARRYQMRAYKRGRHSFAPVEVRSGGPFGVFFAGKEIELGDDLLVYPMVETLSHFPVAGRASAMRRRVQTQARLSNDQQVRSVREFRSDDPRRRIHWRTTARIGDLMVKQFEKQEEVHVSLFLDARAGGEVGEGRETSFEYAVRAAASLVSHAFEEGHQVELIWGENGDVQVHKLDDRWEGLTWLAEVEPESTTSLQRVLDGIGKRLDGGVSLIVLLPFPRQEDVQALIDLRRKGGEIIAVLSDPHSFQSDQPATAPLEQDLQAVGIQTYTLVRGRSISASLAPPGEYGD